MRNSLTSGALVEAAVTVAVAILMTVAGFEMLRGANDETSLHPMSAMDAGSRPRIRGTLPAMVAGSQWPHVDAARA